MSAGEDRPGDGAPDDRVDLEQVVLHDRPADRHREERQRDGEEVERECSRPSRRRGSSRRPATGTRARRRRRRSWCAGAPPADGGKRKLSTSSPISTAPPTIIAAAWKWLRAIVAANERSKRSVERRRRRAAQHVQTAGSSRGWRRRIVALVGKVSARWTSATGAIARSINVERPEPGRADHVGRGDEVELPR